jgi:hypothetical protein
MKSQIDMSKLHRARKSECKILRNGRLLRQFGAAVRTGESAGFEFHRAYGSVVVLRPLRAEEKGAALLRSWLSPEQAELWDSHRHFYVAPVAGRSAGMMSVFDRLPRL